MKIAKSISIFIVCIILLGAGFVLGIMTMNYFYPGDQSLQNSLPAEYNGENLTANDSNRVEPTSEVLDAETIAYGEARAAASAMETLCVDTEYILLEWDVLAETVEETILTLPAKYVGMDREQFVEAMDNYEANPPLSELERGFVNLEVLSFSRDQVKVQMNYKFVQPSSSFYLAVYDNRVIVYLEDKKTIYIQTDIMLENLPAQVQKEIFEMMFVENEEELYDFLESYSS